MDFEGRYKKLNDNQRKAVDTIDGPVMVIAGPGTGKTELLSMRAANILKKTDVLPENILCLTFTDAGSIAMQKRLTSIIGRDAYNVSIFTFHSFGTHIMNKYREYFYNGADFRPADELARHHIVTQILDSLEYNNPLRAQMNGKYTSVGDIISAISDLKRAGLTDEEFRKLLNATEATVQVVGKLLSEVCANRITRSTVEALRGTLETIEAVEEEVSVEGIIPLKEVLANSIRHACEAADNHDKITPPLTAWKKEWMTADVDKAQILKVQKALPRLRALNHVYSLYLQVMQEAELVDFDDMIMQLVHAMEVNDDLRYDLQEKYQYIMVDEFQDTNLAQMRILHNLTNNQVSEGAPNILVVGDDDQAIYGFQGAEVGNILHFKDKFDTVSFVTLTDNYRSAQPILDSAREVIIQGNDRLEGHLEGLNKSLRSHTENNNVTTEIVNFPAPHDERQWIAASVRALIDSGTKPSEIAIIGRKHSDLVALLSYLSEQHVPVSYDRRDNVLDDEVVKLIELTGRVVHAISIGDHDSANELMPEVLSHPSWGIDPTVVWEVSLSAHKNREHWLETMRSHKETKLLFTWFVAAAAQAPHLPLERMIDILIGNEPLGKFTSPLKNYFFSDQKRERDLSTYTTHLENLSTIRKKLREHAADLTTPRLAEYLDFIAANRQIGAHITSFRHVGDDDASIQLLSAHGSKGLEFDHVFIVNATDSQWGEKASSRTPSITFPPHLRLRQSSDEYDERLRLFYVAMTRARSGLHISYANENDAAKEVLKAIFLVGSRITPREEAATSKEAASAAAEHKWYAPLINIPKTTMRDYLAPVLTTYKISATHVNQFVDVTHGGPQHFLLNTLLRFPNAPSAARSYGIAIHAALQRAHEHLRATGSPLPDEDILHEFDKILERLPMTSDELRDYHERGGDTLRAFLKAHSANFSPNQQAELDFKYQDVQLDDVRLTGKLDVIEFDKQSKSAIVTDYKTGKSLDSWNKGAEYQKVKAYKYRQQLLFYKLLIEHSRDWHNYKMVEGILQFVEPDRAGQIVDLRLHDIQADELDRFARLVTVIWRHINDLDFPDTSDYEPTLAGVIQFEDDLLTKQ